MSLKKPTNASKSKDHQTTNGRQLKDLVSVGPAVLKDLSALGIKSVGDLAKCSAKDLYRKLCQLSAQRHDPCVEDVLSAAIAQAKNPNLPQERCDWWFWNRRRQRKTKA
jgi:predicted flap endonuclease-1-like 5' DNA nuclease